MPKTSKSKLEAIARYDKEHARGIYLKLNLGYDADILEKLDSIPPGDGGKQGYIKKLIRDDIAREKK